MGEGIDVKTLIERLQNSATSEQSVGRKTTAALYQSAADALEAMEKELEAERLAVIASHDKCWPDVRKENDSLKAEFAEVKLRNAGCANVVDRLERELAQERARHHDTQRKREEAEQLRDMGRVNFEDRLADLIAKYEEKKEK